MALDWVDKIDEDGSGNGSEVHAEDVNALARAIRDNENSIGVILSTKADKADTLEGYGITDSYTKQQTDAALLEKSNATNILNGTGNKSIKMVDSVASGDYSFAEGSNTRTGQKGFLINATSPENNTYTLSGSTDLSVGDVVSIRAGENLNNLNTLYFNFGNITAIDTGTDTITVDEYQEFSEDVGYLFVVESDAGDTVISGNFAHAEGDNTIAAGEGSHTEGWDTKAIDYNAHAEGEHTIALGEASHAEGHLSVAFGHKSHAEGGNTTAEGNFSHAEGGITTASGDYSHAEGNGTTASGVVSHAEGYNHTSASGYSSHAEGNGTMASGADAHSEGTGTIAAGNSSHVQGKYNVADNNNTYAHIVGNGTSNNARSNAHTVDWDGNGWFAGKVTVGANGNELITEDEMLDKLEPFVETEEIPASANKWNPSTVVRANVSTPGIITPASDGTYVVSDFIPVPVGTDQKIYLYYKLKTQTALTLQDCDAAVQVRVFFFDENKNYTGYDFATTDNTTNVISMKANRPYIRLRIAYQNWNSRDVVASFSPQTEYSAYSEAHTVDNIKAVLEINGETPDSDGSLNIPIVGDVKVNGASVVTNGTANITVPDAYTKTETDERIYDGALSAFYTTPNNVTISSNGLGVGNYNFKFKTFAVLGGARYKVQTSGYWQFQGVDVLASSAPSNRIGETYSGSGEAVAPDNANFLLVGYKNSEEPKVYCTSMSELKRTAFSNVLYGKKYIAAGDSYTQISDATFAKGKYAGEMVTYDRVIRERNFMPGGNRGISGSTMAVPQGGNATEARTANAFSNTRYQNIPSDTDILTIAFGINDNSLCDLGQLGDTTNATFYGAWDVVLKYYAENMPKMKIGIIIFARSDNNGFYTALKNIAKYYGIPYLDFYGGEDTPIYVDGKVYPINAGIDSTKKAYFGIPAHESAEAESFQGISVNTKIGSASMGHPNYKAHIDEATVIEEFLRRL